jgi:hypothetical protein
MVFGLFKITEKLVKMLDPPQVRQKFLTGKRDELVAVKSFSLGPFYDKYYLEDKDGKHELKLFGYSLIRDLTEDEKTLIYNISWYIDDLRNLLVPTRINLTDCSLEDFLTKKLPPLMKKRKTRA